MKLNERMEFDCPVEVRADGTVGDAPANVYGPSVWHDELADVVIEGAGWAPFSTGYTGQYGYRGPVMHASEFIGGALERDILAEPGIYVVTSVECLPEDEDDLEPEPAGWIVLKLERAS